MITKTPLIKFLYAIKPRKRLKVKETTYTFFDPISQAAGQVRSMIQPDVLWSLNGRFERGVDMARHGYVSPYHDPDTPEKHRMYQVKSSHPDRPPYHYLVDLDAATCECPDHWKGYLCKHRIASHIIEIVNANAQRAWANEPVTSPASNPVSQSIPTPLTQAAATPPAQVKKKPVQKPKPSPELDAKSTSQPVIWGLFKHNGDVLGVEILSLDGEMATVRALPKIIGGKKLQSQFPFEGKCCTTTIPKEELFHVKVFR